MCVIAVSSLAEFWSKHPSARAPLMAWLTVARSAKWDSPADIKARFGNASFIGQGKC